MTITERLGGLFAPVAGTLAVALVAGLGFAVAPAAAATCNVANVTTDIGKPSLDCVANVSGGPGGNVTETQMNAGTGVFDKTGWTDFGKIDLPDSGPGNLAADFLKITFSADLKTGTWSLKDGFSFDPTGHYALALKAGAPANGGPPNGLPNGGPKGPSLVTLVQSDPVFNAVYLLDITGTSGTWSTADLRNNGGNQPGLSNITLFGTAAPVPLPAAAWLLIGGIAGLGALKRRRKAAA